MLPEFTKDIMSSVDDWGLKPWTTARAMTDVHPRVIEIGGLFAIGGDTWLVYEYDFDSRDEAQAILDAHNDGAENYEQACIVARWNK